MHGAVAPANTLSKGILTRTELRGGLDRVVRHDASHGKRRDAIASARDWRIPTACGSCVCATFATVASHRGDY